MKSVDVHGLARELSSRDLSILATLREHRLATTTQLRRWHFPCGPNEEISNSITALRIAQRTLRRLEQQRLVVKLQQRVGGARRGSDSIVWQLAQAGDRLLSAVRGYPRRRFLEPRLAFITHTLAVTELAVELVEAQQRGLLAKVALIGEPANWRRFLGPHGQQQILKPDLHAITWSSDYEDHWMIERDLSTEHPSVVARQADIYARYTQTGNYQDEHGILPAVLWVVNDQHRQRSLIRVLAEAPSLTPGMHQVVLATDFINTVVHGIATPPDN